MGSTKLISSCLVVIFILIAIIMGHSASGRTLTKTDKKEISMTYFKIDGKTEKIKQNIISGKNDSNNDGNKDDDNDGNKDDDNDGNKDDDKNGKKECKMQPMDCAEVLRSGHTKSGVYTICPKNIIINESVEVYCDMDTDGGGWTVIQRRGDFGRPEDYFFKDWENYKNGFGDIKEDFWLGNDLIFAITNQAKYSIRFDLSDVEESRAYADYDNFWIEDEEEQYRLHIRDYSGNANDSMIYHDNMKFSTKDRDNDKYLENSCAEVEKGAWWYNYCAYSNLNGLYLKAGTISSSGMIWYHWKNYESLSTTEMKIRPKSFLKF